MLRVKASTPTTVSVSTSGFEELSRGRDLCSHLKLTKEREIVAASAQTMIASTREKGVRASRVAGMPPGVVAQQAELEAA